MLYGAEHRTSKSIRDEANVMNMLDLIKVKRLQWLGHVYQREREWDVERVCELRDEGRRKRGHQKHRLEEPIRKDLQSCSLCEEDTQNRIRWKGLIELGL